MRVDIKGWHSYVLLPPFNNREWISPPFGVELKPLSKDTETLIRPIQSDGRTPMKIGDYVGTQDGGRNDVMYKAAMSLYNKHDDEVTILAMLNGLNQTFNPPLSVSEFDSQVSRAKQRVEMHPMQKIEIEPFCVKGDKKGNSESTHFTDMGNAYKIAEMFGDKIRYDHRRNRWLVWRDHRWVNDDAKSIKLFAMEMAKQRMREVVDIEGKEEKRKAFRFAINCEGKSKIDSSLDLLKSIEPVADTGENWDRNNMMLVCNNGILDFENGVFRPGVPEDRATMCKIGRAHV